MEPMVNCSNGMAHVASGLLAVMCVVIAIRWKTRWFWRASLIFVAPPLYLGALIVLLNVFFLLNFVTLGVACIPFF